MEIEERYRRTKADGKRLLKRRALREILFERRSPAIARFPCGANPNSSLTFARPLQNRYTPLAAGKHSGPKPLLD